MNDIARNTNHRKLMVIALMIVAGLALCAGIGLAAIEGVRLFQANLASWETGQEAVQQASQEPAHEVGPETLRPEREIPQQARMIGIITLPRTVQLDYGGDPVRLSVQGLYSDGGVGELENIPGETVSYTSSDAAVARVDSRGVVSGVKAGGADVVASYGGFESSVPIFVWAPVRPIPPVDQVRLLEVSEDGTAVVLNRVMVKLGPGYVPEDAWQLASIIGGNIVFEFRTFPGYIVDFDAHTKADLDHALAVLQADGRVAAVYPDMAIPSGQGPTPETIANNLHIDLDAYLYTGITDAWRVMNLIDPQVFNRVVIAVIDMDFPGPKAHPDEHLAYPVMIPEFGSEIRVMDLVPPDYDDPEHHGAAVTSILAAKNNIPPVNDRSFSGVVSSVEALKYQLIFFAIGQESGEGVDKKTIATASGLINALEHLESYSNQLDVVNMSIAMTCEKPLLMDCGLQYDLADLMKGMPDVTFVVGAGNENMDTVEKNVIPASFTVKRGKREKLDNVITVGGLSRNARHPHSNYGSAVTLGAPYNVWSLRPQDMDGYGLNYGTSYATPLVAGTVALLKAVDPGLSPSKIKALLGDAAGSVNVCNSGTTPCGKKDQTKWKRLDADAALEAVIRESVKGVILHASVSRASTLSLGSAGAMGVNVTVGNAGSIERKFRVDMVDTTSGDQLLDSATGAIAPRESRKFNLRLDGPTPVQQLEVRLYPGGRTTVVLDSKGLTIPPTTEAPTSLPTSTLTPARHPIGTPTPTPYRLPGTEAFLLRQTLVPSQSPKLPYEPNSRPFSEWPEPPEVVERGTNFIFWWFAFDMTHVPEDVELDGLVRLVDVTYSDQHLVMWEGQWQLGGDVGDPGKQREIPRSAVVPRELDTGQDVLYEVKWYGLGHQDEPYTWQLGLYQLQLLDDRGEVLSHLPFEVR